METVPEELKHTRYTLHECEISGYLDKPTWQEMEECYRVQTPGATVPQVFIPESIRVFPLVHVYSAVSLNNHTLYLGRLGHWYYLSYRGKRLGPVFDDVYPGGCCEYGLYGPYIAEGAYGFRGKRGGKTYLIIVSFEAP